MFLRRPAKTDLAEFQALRLASRAFLTPWESTQPGGIDNFSPAYFERVLSTQSESNHRFLVCDASTGAIIGALSLGNIVRGAFQSCYAGYWIGSEFAGKGLMTEALTLALAHAFQDLDLHRVEANIVPENVASKALVRKLGFRHEGVAKRYLCINGRWRDHEHWAMTLEDWRRLRPGLMARLEAARTIPRKRRPTGGS
ncbi:MAG: GNAT family N-acetyltransferase [Phycisphaerales bacterium]|nr:GNAT family N-acetyltransferase [Phycisphaerales bacterium]